MKFTLTRLGSLAIAFIATKASMNLSERGAGEFFYFQALFAFGMSHYVLSYAYGRNRIVGLARTPRSWIPVAIVLALTGAVFAIDIPSVPKLFLWFALHHAFNEVYLLYPREKGDGRGGLRTVAVLFHLGAYPAVVSQALLSRVVEPWKLLAVAVGFGMVYAVAIVRARRTLGSRRHEQEAWLDLGVTLLVAAGAGLGMYRLTVFDIVYYHFAFWVVWPLWGMLRSGSGRDAVAYLGATAGITLALLGATAGENARLSRLLADSFFNFSFLHIGTALALSSANPAAITRWFEGTALKPAEAEAS